MYKDVYEAVDGHVVGKITSRSIEGKKDKLSFCVGRQVVAEEGKKVTYWFHAKHLPGIRAMLDKLELYMIKLEEQAT